MTYLFGTLLMALIVLVSVKAIRIWRTQKRRARAIREGIDRINRGEEVNPDRPTPRSRDEANLPPKR